MDYTPLCVVGISLLRSVSGWAKNALSVKSPSGTKVDDFEYRELVATVIRVGVLGLIVAYFPGLNLAAHETAIVALSADYIFNLIKKLRKN